MSQLLTTLDRCRLTLKLRLSLIFVFFRLVASDGEHVIQINALQDIALD